MRKKSLLLASGLGLALSGALVGYVSGAVGVNSGPLRDAVTLDGVRAHQAALQAIADANGGTRASGTPGFEASLAYVKARADAAGLVTTVQEFDFPFFQELSPAQFSQTQPGNITYTLGTDFQTMEYSGSGDVTALIDLAGGIQLPPGPTASSSSSGCTAADFAGFAVGSVALIQRGTCTFAEKALNAQAAGASAVIIFNEGQPGRTEVLSGTLGGPGLTIPVIGTTFALGETLATTPGVQVHIVTDTQSEIRHTANLIGETAGGRSDRVVVVGAHLDSVVEGPGINDNGSGTAGLLEIAEEMKELGIKPVNKVRFAWWGAEESGLLGSEHYVAQLTKRQIKDIAVNLNFDMIGSPNYVNFIYDGDGSATGTAGPNGSSIVEKVFAKFFTKVGEPFEATAFDGRSDYGPFIAVGIPAGGLFTGAEGIKTAAEAALYGGTAGAPYDPCYHQACDTFANNSIEGLDLMADAAADAVLQFAMTTSAVKGTSQANDAAVKSVDAGALLFKGGHLQK